MNGAAPPLVLWLVITCSVIPVAIIRYQRARRLATLGVIRAPSAISPQRNLVGEIIASIIIGGGAALLFGDLWPQVAAPDWMKVVPPVTWMGLAAMHVLKAIPGDENGRGGSRVFGFFFAALALFVFADVLRLGWIATLLIPLTALVGVLRPRVLTGLPDDEGLLDIPSQEPNFTVRLLCGMTLGLYLIVVLLLWGR